MTEPVVERDERTIAVENASFRWAYFFLWYGLLVLILYRGLAFGEDNWDLMGLFIASAAVGILYQAAHKVLSRSWAWVTLVAMLVGAVVAAGIVYFK